MTVNVTAVAIASGVIELLAALVTLFRLALRLRIRRFWWEDVWAAVAMVCAIAFAIVILVYFQTQNFETADVVYWIGSYLFTSIVWSVRMSLLYSTVRVTSPTTSLRKLMRTTGGLFVVAWAMLLTLKTWWCENHPQFDDGRPLCIIPYPMAIFEVTADFAGDAALVILSLRLFWRVKLPRRQRRMILSIFSSSAIISISSLLRATAQIINNIDLQLIFVNVEVVLSLVVCNLLVVVTYIYRAYICSSESEDASEDDDFTTPVFRSTRGTQCLTTVDLSIPSLTTVEPSLITCEQASGNSFLTMPIPSGTL